MNNRLTDGCSKKWRMSFWCLTENQPLTGWRLHCFACDCSIPLSASVLRWNPKLETFSVSLFGTASRWEQELGNHMWQVGGGHSLWPLHIGVRCCCHCSLILRSLRVTDFFGCDELRLSIGPVANPWPEHVSGAWVNAKFCHSTLSLIIWDSRSPLHSGFDDLNQSVNQSINHSVMNF